MPKLKATRRYHEIVANPETPSDWIEALKNPHSPVFKKLLELANAKDMAEANIFCKILEIQQNIVSETEKKQREIDFITQLEKQKADEKYRLESLPQEKIPTAQEMTKDMSAQEKEKVIQDLQKRIADLEIEISGLKKRRQEISKACEIWSEKYTQAHNEVTEHSNAIFKEMANTHPEFTWPAVVVEEAKTNAAILAEMDIKKHDVVVDVMDEISARPEIDPSERHFNLGMLYLQSTSFKSSMAESHFPNMMEAGVANGLFSKFIKELPREKIIKLGEKIEVERNIEKELKENLLQGKAINVQLLQAENQYDLLKKVVSELLVGKYNTDHVKITLNKNG